MDYSAEEALRVIKELRSMGAFKVRIGRAGITVEFGPAIVADERIPEPRIFQDHLGNAVDQEGNLIVSPRETPEERRRREVLARIEEIKA
jgi:hypothetical protein